jgi:hypothetical protein
VLGKRLKISWMLQKRTKTQSKLNSDLMAKTIQKKKRKSVFQIFLRPQKEFLSFEPVDDLIIHGHLSCAHILEIGLHFQQPLVQAREGVQLGSDVLGQR